QRSKFLALQQFDIPVQNRERCFQVVSGGAESVRSALESLLQLGVRLQQITQIGRSFPLGRGRWRGRLCFGGLGNTSILLRGGHKGRRSNTEGGCTRHGRMLYKNR